MHELSIAQCLIDVACEAASERGACSVSRLNIRLGAMSGVVPKALLFSFELAAEDTLCAGAELHIEEIPVTLHCPSCDVAVSPPNAFTLCCPDCGTRSPQILTGREMELVSLEVDAHETACA